MTTFMPHPGGYACFDYASWKVLENSVDVSPLFSYDVSDSTLSLIGDASVAGLTFTYEIGIFFYVIGTT